MPPRSFCILARKAPIGVIIRRGPSGSMRLVRWHTRTHQIERGQWLHAHIYARRCDLSPDGKLFATLATFRRSAAHFSIRPYGAAQMQLIFRGETSSEERDACFQEFMTALGPLIKEIRTGATSE